MKLITENDKEEYQHEHLEVSLDKFYELLHQLSKAKASFEHLKYFWMYRIHNKPLQFQMKAVKMIYVFL